MHGENAYYVSLFSELYLDIFNLAVPVAGNSGICKINIAKYLNINN